MEKSGECELMKGLTALLSLTNLVVLPGKLSECKTKCVGEN